MFAIYGTGLRHRDRHGVILRQAGKDAPPFIANWRVQGPGQELAAGREMVQELQAELGAEQIEWLLTDGAYVDGAWLAELQRAGVGVMMQVYAEMQISEEMLALTTYPASQFEPYLYLYTVRG